MGKQNCKWFNKSDGSENALANDLYSYLRESNSVTLENVERILMNHKVITKSRDRGNNLRTYLKMGKDSMINQKIANGINSRVRLIFGEDTPNLIKIEKLKKVTGNIYNPINDLYSAEINTSAINSINGTKTKKDVLATSRETAIIVEDFEKLRKEANEDIIPLSAYEQRGSKYHQPEALQDASRKIDALKLIFNTNVIFDDSIEHSRVDAYVPGEIPTIRINPNKLFKDTVIHEFAHIYVDLLGGINNTFILDGIEQLRGTEAWNYVIENYPDIPLESEEFYKEVIATAVGWAGTKYEAKSPISRWIYTFFQKLKALIGVQPDVAMKLATDLLTNHIGDITQGKLSSYNQEQRSLSEHEKVISKAQNTLIYKIKYLEKEVEKLTVEDENYLERANQLESLKKIASELKSLKATEGIVSFIKTAIDETIAVQDKINQLDSKAASIKELNYFKNYIAGYYNTFKDLMVILPKDSELEGDLDAMNLLDATYKSYAIMESITTKALNLSKEITAENMAKKIRRIESKYRLKYGQDFRNSIPKGKESTAEYKEAEQAYINKRVAENRAKIDAEELDNITSILETAPRDIMWQDAYLVDPKAMNDDIIQYAALLLDRADYEAKQEFINEIQIAEKFYDEYISEVGSKGVLLTDTKALYDAIIENEVDENGKLTGEKSQHYVTKYYSKFYEVKRSYSSKVDWKLTGKELKESQPFIDYTTWMKNNTTKVSYGDKYGSVPSEKWVNPQWEALQQKQDSATFKMYSYIDSLAKARDKKLPSNARLYSKLPSILKDTRERLKSQNIIETFKDIKKNVTEIRPDDTEFGQLYVLGDERGKEKQHVPIYYRYKIDKADQSYDLLGIMLKDFHMAVNYNNKVQVLPDLEVLKDLMGNRKFVKRVGIKKKLNALLSKEKSVDIEMTDEGVSTNAMKALESLIETRLYGIKAVGSYHKLANNLIRFTGMNTLAFNVTSGIMNILQGKIATWIESGSNGLYTKTDVLKADTKYWLDAPRNTADYISKKSTSRTHKLNNLYNVSDSFALTYNPEKNTAVKKLLGSGGLDKTNQFNESGEHYMQNTLMYTILETIKPMTKDGKYIKKDGSLTTDISEAISIDEAYTQDKDGNLILDPRVTTSNKGTINPFEISLLIKHTMRNMFGNYSSENIAIAQRYAIGKLAYLLRRWMPRGYKYRFRGVSNAFKDKDSIDPNLMYYSPETGMEEEGYYTTGLRFFSTIYKDLLKLKILTTKEKWNTLSDYEKKNAMKMYKELGLIVLAYTASKALEGMADDADDEDKEWLYFTAFLARRSYSELSFYVNPIEFTNILKSPTAASRTIDDMLDVVGFIIPEIDWDNDGLSINWMLDDRYKKGRRKGQLKFKKELGDLIPIVNKLDDSYEDKYNYITK